MADENDDPIGDSDDASKEEQQGPAGENEAEPGAGEDVDARRRLMVLGSCGIGGAISLGVAYPLVRYLLFPVGEAIVSSPDAPIDVLGADELVAGGLPIKVELIASGVRNGWSVSDRVALGSAWLRKTAAGEIVAFSAVCPHLGCAIAFAESEKTFQCPCHSSAFALEGEKITGPSKRGLDPLPVEVADGRVLVTFKRFRQDIADRVEV